MRLRLSSRQKSRLVPAETQLMSPKKTPWRLLPVQLLRNTTIRAAVNAFFALSYCPLAARGRAGEYRRRREHIAPGLQCAER